jgi:hypothetical protein
MRQGPRPRGQPWTPEDDAQLLALLESKLDRMLIARKLKRTVKAINTRKVKLKPQGRALTDEPSLPRFMIRQGAKGLMVWDRQRKGPAMYNGQQAIGLTEYQANEIKLQLSRFYAE